MTREEMQDLVYDPSLVQKKVLDYVKNYNNGERKVSDPTNPFTMLLESAALTASSAIIECNNIIRKKYPSLASKEDDLYVHVTDSELANMFSVPAEVNITIFVNVVDLQLNGLRPEGANFYETTIPKYTEFTILDVPFTLLNDIVVRVYDNNNVYAEVQLNNENDIAYKDMGTLEAVIYSSAESTPWITFEVKVKQLKRYVKTKTVIASEGFKDMFTVNDKYFYSNVSYKNSNTNGKYLTISKSHNEEYIDPNKPTAFISIYNKNILYKIPDVYLVDGSISGNVMIEIYDTRGKMYLPVNKYPNSDWKIKLGNVSESVSSATSENISIRCLSSDVVNGGMDGFTLEELRTSIINNTTGEVVMPITDKQLERSLLVKGYAISKSEDVITSRLYLALRSLPDIDNSLVYCKQDIFFNTCRLVIADISKYDSVIVNDDNFIIKSNSVFKENNGITTLCTPEEIKVLNDMPSVRLIEHLSTFKYFYNPYYYVISNNETYTNSTVYDFDTPEIKTHSIIDKNLTMQPRSNIGNYNVSKVDNGYLVQFTLVTNDEFKQLGLNTILVRGTIRLYGGQDVAYIDATYDEKDNLWSILIETTFNVDAYNRLDLINGFSNLATKRIDLDNILTIYTGSTNTSLQDPTNMLVGEFNKPNIPKLTVFTKEELHVNLGNRMDYIYNKLYNVYNDKKYKVHEYDVPKVHEKDVYDIDPITGIGFDIIGNGPTGTLKYKIKHNKGDPVLDENGIQVYKHKKGDFILDPNGEPIIDTGAGVIRYIDVMLLEYEFLRANASAYIGYRKLVLDCLKKFIQTDMKDINSDLLENTKICYKSYKTSQSVSIIVNKAEEKIPYMVIPHVLLYLKNTNSITIDRLESYKNIVGSIISKHCDMAEIVVENIKEDIKKAIGTIVAGVKITNLEPSNGEIITIKNPNIKLTLSKLLAVNKNSEYIVKYNMKLDIQYIS